MINIKFKVLDSDFLTVVDKELWQSQDDETIDDCPICLPQLVEHLQTTSAIDGLYRTIEIEINPESEEEDNDVIDVECFRCDMKD